MPELPEVETIRRYLWAELLGDTCTNVVIRRPDLRWPIDVSAVRRCIGRTVRDIRRRGKYLMVAYDRGHLIVHLGMSGRLGVVRRQDPPGPHDHVEWWFRSGKVLRLRDPRRFGSVFWTENDPCTHPRLAELGPEPFDRRLTGRRLYARSRGRKTSVKAFLMDARVIAGLGNIYTTEALFRAGIRPDRPVGDISQREWSRILRAIRSVLRAAIRAGGTSLRDYTRADGTPGMFQMRLSVYRRAGLPCIRCGTPVQMTRIAGRSTYFCPRCQR